MQRDEVGGRMLLGDGAVDGAVKLRLIRFQCAVVWVSAGLPCVFMYLIFFIPKCYRNTTYRSITQHLIVYTIKIVYC